MPSLPPGSHGGNAKHLPEQAEKMHECFRDWECCASRYTCVPEVRCVVHGTKPFQAWKTRLTARTPTRRLAQGRRRHHHARSPSPAPSCLERLTVTSSVMTSTFDTDFGLVGLPFYVLYVPSCSKKNLSITEESNLPNVLQFRRVFRRTSHHERSLRLYNLSHMLVD